MLFLPRVSPPSGRVVALPLVFESEELQSAVLVRNLRRPPGRGGRCDGVLLLLLAVNCDFIVLSALLQSVQKTPDVGAGLGDEGGGG